jgi:hypothetical protein
MNRVDTTVSFTPGSTSAELGALPRLGAFWRVALALFGMFLLCLGPTATPAAAREPQVEHISLQRTAEGLYLSARLEVAPSAAVEDALLRGVPLYFVWQIDVVRDRWYWSDKRVASAQRTLRLVYQPLTRRWRVSVSNLPDAGRGGAGLQYALHQNFDDLAGALAGVSRVLRWRIADAAELAPGVDQRVELAFRLDLTLLPRPFQIGMANQPEWQVNVQRQIEVPGEIEPEAPPVLAPDAVGLEAGVELAR